MTRIPHTSPSNLRVFTACLLSFMMLVTPLASVAGSVKAAAAASSAKAKSKTELTAEQKLESYLFANAPLPLPTPDVTATMSDAFTDSDTDNKAEFGETITYTADIANNAAAAVDATNVKFDASIDPNTTLVAGSVKVSPLAFADTYVVTKGGSISPAAPGLLGNDTGKPLPTVKEIVGCGDTTAPYVCTTSPNNGALTVNEDGSFTYTPDSNFQGTDTFQYVVKNDNDPTWPTDTATVTLNVDAAPTVTSTIPADNAIGVAPNATITVNFSENVNITANTFKLECPTGTPIGFNVSPAVPGGDDQYVLTPTSPLPGNVTCTVTVESTEVTDTDTFDGPDAMAADYVFDFQTDAAPTVQSTSPVNGAADVKTDANIVITFSEAVDAAAGAFKVECPSGVANAQPFVASGSGTSVLTLNPSAELPAGVTCTVTVVAANITDDDSFDPPDNLEPGDYVFSFTTDAAPTVTTTTPANNATNVVTTAPIVVNFSEPVDATLSSFTIKCPAANPTAHAYTLSTSPSASFSLTPTAPLPQGTICQVTVHANQITDDDGNDPPDNLVPGDYVFSFTTDFAPTVTTTTPANGAVKVASNADVVITFSETVNVTSNWFSIVCGTSGTHDTTNSTFSNVTNVYTINPTDFTPGETCNVTIVAAQVADTDNFDPPDVMSSNHLFSFTVDLPPSVTTTSPADNATGVAIGTNIDITFDEPVDATTNSFTIECPDNSTPQAYALSSNPAKTIYTLNPSADLPAGVVCTVTVLKDEISDTDSGDPPDHMTADKVFTFKIPPVANADTYPETVIGNVSINSGNVTVPFSVTANDLFVASDPVVIDKVNSETNVVGGTITTTTGQGGTVVMIVSGPDRGEFSYNPPAGYEGPDSFTYQITNGGGSATATVSLSIQRMVWFINAASPSCTSVANGCGRLSNPFNSVTDFQAANGIGAVTGNNPANDDNIFIYENSTAYDSALFLRPGHKVIGQDSTSSLATLIGLPSGIVPSGSAPLPAMNPGNGTTTKLTSSGANDAILLSTNNHVYGLTIGNTGGTGINGNSFTTLTVADVAFNDSPNRTGRALLLNGGQFLGTGFTTTNSTSGANAVSLTNVTGTVNLGNGALSGSSGAVLNVVQGNGSVNYSGTISSTVNLSRAVSITDKTGGTVALSGAISATSGVGINPVGVFLSNNAGATINLTGGLTLSTGTSTAFTATGPGPAATSGGTINVPGTNNTITATTGGGLHVTNTTIGSSGLNFKSITSSSGTNSANIGIILENTGSTAGLTVTGTGTTAGSGGTISNKNGGNLTSGSGTPLPMAAPAVRAGTGIFLKDTSSVSISNMTLQNFTNFGIFGRTVNGLTLAGTTINTTTGKNGDDTNQDEGSMTFDDLTGTVSITNCSIEDGQEANARIVNRTGTLNLTITGSTFKDTTASVTGLQGLLLQSGAAAGDVANITANITNSTFTNNYARGIQAVHNYGGTMEVNIGTSAVGSGGTFDNNFAGVDIAHNGSGATNFNVKNATFSDDPANVGPHINIFMGSGSTAGSAFQGRVHGNVITGSNNQCCAAIAVVGSGAGTMTVAITDNIVTQIAQRGISVAAGQGSNTVNATITGNTVTLADPNSAEGIFATASVNSGDTSTMNATIGGSTLALKNNVSSVGGHEIRAEARFGRTFVLPGYAGGAQDTTAVQNFLAANNTINGGTTSATVGLAPMGSFVGNPPTPTPTNNNPLKASMGGVESVTHWTDIVPASSIIVETGIIGDAELETIAAAAVKRWEAAGLNASQIAALHRLNFEVADLSGEHVAEATGDRIRIDRDAAGYKWFVDATPMDDAEFGNAASGSRRYTDASGAPAGRIDLLTALMHEIGHYLNLSDSYETESRDNLMYGYLTKGERRLPLADQVSNTTPGEYTGTHYLSVLPENEINKSAAKRTATVSSHAKGKAKAQAFATAAAMTPLPVAELPVDIGTIPAGKTVRVSYQLKVKDAVDFTGTSAQVSSQGTVTVDDPNGGTFNVLTDDQPGTAAPNEPTVTPVDSQPDLVLTKTEGGGGTVPGGVIAYTLDYNNTNGKRQASGVTITETVPANTIFNQSASTGVWSCANGSIAGTTCTQTIGNVAAGGSGTTTFAVTVLSVIPAGVTDISNTALIADDGSIGADGNAADNTAIDTTPVTAAPDMKLLKSDGNVGVKKGETVTYTLTYSNEGNQGATGVTISETVPADSTFETTGSAAGWSCSDGDPAGTTCTINIGSVAAGTGGTVAFVVTTVNSPVGTEVSNTATIDEDGTNGTDPAGNDTGSDTTPFDDPPTLGDYPATTVLVSDSATVNPVGNVAPNDDNPGFTVAVSASAGFTGTLAVNQTTGVVTITNAGPASASPYTITVTVTDSPLGQQTSETFDLTVSKSATVTSLISLKNPSFNNQQVTFEATVISDTAITGPPTGTVDFFDGATLICDDKPLSGPSNKATCDISTLSVGGSPHSITAVYNGDALFKTSTSNTVLQNVNPSLNLIVNTLGDAGDINIGDEACDSDVAAGDQCTLRAAIEESNFVPSDDIIDFDAALDNSTITLDTALDAFPVNGNLIINGLGADDLTVERNSAAATDFRIFEINSGKTVTISGLTIKGGKADNSGVPADGSGILNQGTLTLNDSVVTGNSGNSGTITGVGISNYAVNGNASLTINNSTISGNTGALNGGGISNRGSGATRVATLVINNSTISGNTATAIGAGGGGLFNISQSGGTATVTINDSTISGNSATSSGGGIRNTGTASATVTLNNTIVSDNTATTGPDISKAAGGLHGSFNIIEDATGFTFNTGTDNTNVDPLLQKDNLGQPLLQNNGGPTPTIALLPDSPALDAGDNALAAAFTLDQRGTGFNRVVDSNDAGVVATVDIGAFEAQVTIEDISDTGKGTIEDVTLPAFNFEVSDGGVTAFDVSASSDNTTLVPNNAANLILGGGGSTRSLSIKPADDKFGSANITVTVSGTINGTPVSMSDTFLFTVTPIADTPDVADAATTEDTQTGFIAVLRNPVDTSEVSHFRVTGITGGKLYYPDGTTRILSGEFVAFADVAGTGLKFTPTLNSVAPGSFTVQAATGNVPAALGGGTDTSTITVSGSNDPPNLAPIPGRNILEDAGLQTVNLSSITAGGGESQTLTITATSSDTSVIPNPTVTYTSPDSTGSLSFTPVANAFGSATITVTVNDNGGGTETASRSFVVNVTSVNDAPTFTKGANQSVGEDSGAQTVNGWATNVGPGPANESAQTFTINTTNNNNGLFSVQPVVSPTGTLTYTPAANTTGTATVTVTLVDNGGTANGGQNTTVDTFTITVNAVNDAPVNTVPGAQTVNTNGTLVFSAANSNLISVADSDAGANNVTVNLIANKGTATLSTIAGLAFSSGDGTSDAVMTFSGTLANINAALNGMSFKPNSGYAGAASLKVTTNDLGNTGSGGSKIDVDNIAITVASGGTLAFSAATYAVNEGTSSITVTVKRTGGSNGTTHVNYATSNGTATAGQDYAATSGQLTFNNGEITKSFNIAITNDTLDEANETVNLTLSNVLGNGQLGSPATAVLTITDNDPLPSLSVDDVSVTEGNAGTVAANFTVSLSAASGQTVTVNFSTSDNSATAGSDYTAVPSTLVTFNPGETSKLVPVTVKGDTGFEPNETFVVNLLFSSHASIADAQGVGTILNDDTSTFQLSSAVYSVAEGQRRVTITVNRSGDKSVPATVNYATSDPSALTPCASVTGHASDRCDYATTVGTLRFVANQASRTFTVPVVNDVYAEGPEELTITLSKALGAELGATKAATITITDDDAGGAPNPLFSDEFFIRELYKDLLGREADSAGLAGWMATLKDCTTPETCDRVAVTIGFLQSPEFKDRGYFAYRFIRAALGRLPRYDEIIPDMARVSGFLKAAELADNKADYVDDFMDRPEFRQRYDSKVTPTAYVNALLQTVGLPNHPQRTAWINGLTNQSLTRAGVLRALIESQEVYDKFINEASVVMNYFGLLRRDPDSKYQQWLALLNQTNDFRAIVAGFINSLEYRQRFGPAQP